MLSNCGVGEDFWSPLDCKEIKPVNSKGNQSWIFIGKTDGEVESPILWPLDAKSQLTGKGPDAGKDWGQDEKGVTEDEMVRWHHWLNRHKFEQTPGDSEGQGRKPGVLHSIGVTKSQIWLSNWTTTITIRTSHIVVVKPFYVSCRIKQGRKSQPRFFSYGQERAAQIFFKYKY